MPIHLQYSSKTSAAPRVAAKQVFVSYAHEDQAEVGEFMQQLNPLVQSAGLEVFFDRAALRAGDDWSRGIEEALERCELFLLFVSPACLASTYCIKAELLAALNRHARQQCRIVPIILKPCMWEILPLPNGSRQTLGAFQAEPEGAQAVTLRSGGERGALWVQIVRSVAAFTGHAPVPAAAPPAPPAAARAPAGRCRRCCPISATNSPPTTTCARRSACGPTTRWCSSCAPTSRTARTSSSSASSSCT